MMDQTKTFEIGKTYQTRSIGDYNCIIQITIVSRTDKTVTCRFSRGDTDYKTKTFRPRAYRDVEQVKPWGSYSMAPIVSADQEVAS